MSTSLTTNQESGVGYGQSVSGVALMTGGPWTTLGAAVETFFTGPQTAMGGLVGGLAPGGILSLVTPVAIDSGNGAYDFPQFQGFFMLELAFVPEPRGLLLLATAVLTVIAARRRR